MRDLFGEKVEPIEANGQLTLAMTPHREGTNAWLLSHTGREVDARWVPKSEAKRGEGRDENVWTMPVWLARDRGWM